MQVSPDENFSDNNDLNNSKKRRSNQILPKLEFFNDHPDAVIVPKSKDELLNNNLEDDDNFNCFCSNDNNNCKYFCCIGGFLAVICLIVGFST